MGAREAAKVQLSPEVGKEWETVHAQADGKGARNLGTVVVPSLAGTGN